jgi:hypothetical protein
MQTGTTVTPPTLDDIAYRLASAVDWVQGDGGDHGLRFCGCARCIDAKAALDDYRWYRTRLAERERLARKARRP